MSYTWRRYNMDILQDIKVAFIIAEENIINMFEGIDIHGEYRKVLQNILGLDEDLFDLLYFDNIDEYIKNPNYFTIDDIDILEDKDLQGAFDNMVVFNKQFNNM